MGLPHRSSESVVGYKRGIVGNSLAAIIIALDPFVSVEILSLATFGSPIFVA
jgi:hypothetical protein